ncbi:hypothetical protein KA977_04100, partial [Candidatus Dependentiae bacterium]|nr:hypothetical protein [Candidatus Dependentiae bacterium]
QNISLVTGTNGSWSGTAALTKTGDIVCVKLTDRFGINAYDTITINYYPFPKIEIQLPSSSSYDTSVQVITVSGTTLNSQSGNMVTIYTNSNPNTPFLISSANGVFSGMAILTGLGDSVIAELTDSFGRTAYDTITVNYYSDFSIKIISPSNYNDTNSNMVVLKGTSLNSKSGDTISLYVNGILKYEIPVSSNNENWEYYLSETTSGTDVINAVLKDNFGRYSADTIIIIFDFQAPVFAGSNMNKNSYMKGETIVVTVNISNYNYEDTIILKPDFSEFDSVFSADSVIVKDNFDGSFTVEYRINKSSEGNIISSGIYHCYITASDKFGNISADTQYYSASYALLNCVEPVFINTEVLDSDYYYKNGDIIRLGIKWSANENDSSNITVIPDFSGFDSYFEPMNVIVNNSDTGYSYISYQISASNAISVKSGTIPIIISDGGFSVLNQIDSQIIILDNNKPSITSSYINKTYFKNGDLVEVTAAYSEIIDASSINVDFSMADSLFDSGNVSFNLSSGYLINLRYVIRNTNTILDNENLPIYITVKDLAGNSKTDSLYISLDNTKPSASIIFPDNNQVFNSPAFTITGSASDIDGRGDISGKQASEISGVFLSIDADTDFDEIYDICLAENVSVTDKSNTGSGELCFSSWEYNMSSYYNSNILIKVNSTDNAGNQSGYIDTTFIIYNSVPNVKIVYPVYTDTSIKSIKIAGTTENTRYGDSIQIYVNGILNYSSSLSGINSGFEGFVNLTGFGDKITAKVTGYGGVTYDTITVNYYSVPKISIITVSQDTFVSSVIVYGTSLNSKTGDIVVIYNNHTAVNTASVYLNNWNSVITLNEGVNEIYAEIIRVFGDTAVSSSKVINYYSEPCIKINAPINNSDTFSNSIIVSGTALNCKSGDSVVIYKNNEIQSVSQVSSNMNWSDMISLSGLNDKVSVKLTDKFNRTSYDTVIVSYYSGLSISITSPGNNYETGAAYIAVSGNVTGNGNGDVITLYDNDIFNTYVTTAGFDNNWSAFIGITNNGDTIRAVITDRFGRTAESKVFINSYSNPDRIVIQSGQYQLLSINDYSANIIINVKDKNGKIIPNSVIKLTAVSPSDFVPDYTLSEIDRTYYLKIRPLKKAGSYIFKISETGSGISEYIELETTEREFYKNNWSMFSIPVQSQQTLYNQFMSVGDRNYLYIWSSNNSFDRWNTKYVKPSGFERGKSYWFKFTGNYNVTDTKTISLTGSQTIEQNKTVNLYAGWNQIGNPNYYYVDWDNCKIIYGNKSYSPYQAEENGIIQNALYWYERSDSEQYGYIQTPALTVEKAYLKPYFGAWLYVHKNCQLLYDANFVSPSQSYLDTVPQQLAPKKNQGQNEWFIELSAESARHYDKNNFIGVSSTSEENFDRNDKFKAPRLADDYLELSFSRETWNNEITQYSSDIRKPFDTYKFWYFTLSTDVSNTEIELKWNYVSGIPDNFEIYLENIRTHTLINMREQTGLKLSSGQNGMESEFVVKIGTKEYLEILRAPIISNCDNVIVYPNPYIPNANNNHGRQYTNVKDGQSGIIFGGITAGAEIKIYTVTGKLVKEYYHIGNQSFWQWDGCNGSGNELASGWYLYAVKINGTKKTGKLAVIR